MKRIAVLIPCFNEELTIGNVIENFKKHLPEATIYVFDNNSSDETAAIATKAGAVVYEETRQGKGHTVRSMFRQIDADIYVMIDGDSTYPVSEVDALIEPVRQGKAEMVVGDRLSSKAYQKENKRLFHEFGNSLVRWTINKLFRSDLKDIMSGYRVFSRFFVKTCPILSEGFEVETELTLHALDKRLRLLEVPIQYKDRPEGSSSKLNTYLDGIKILKTIFWVFKDYKPFVFFSVCSLLVAAVGLFIGAFPVMEYIRESYVYRVPSAVLAAALEIMAMLLFGIGVTLDTLVTQDKASYELELLKYGRKDDD